MSAEPSAERIIEREQATLGQQQHGCGGELLAHRSDLETGVLPARSSGTDVRKPADDQRVEATRKRPLIYVAIPWRMLGCQRNVPAGTFRSSPLLAHAYVSVGPGV